MKIKLLLSLVIAVALAGCIQSPDLTQSQSIQLEKDAKEMLTSEIGYVSPLLWPDSVKRLHPNNVTRTGMGVFIATTDLIIVRAGFFVPQNPAVFSARDDTSIKFKEINGDLYSYYASD